jgi:heme/copper-type cytochrome/quinol oxidase subunit 2
MDIQVILVFILALLTVNLIVVGVYVVLVLKEFRETLKQANVVIGDVRSISSVVSNPITLVSGFVTALVKGYQATKSIRSIRDSEDEN